MNEVYYRVTFEDRGFFSSVHDLLDYLGDAAYDQFDEVAYEDIGEALHDLEYKLYCPNLKRMDAIFAYTAKGYERFRLELEILSSTLTHYGFEKLKMTELETDEIVYEDENQIAFIPKEGEWEI